MVSVYAKYVPILSPYCLDCYNLNDIELYYSKTYENVMKKV